jgi:hypothetical protein
VVKSPQMYTLTPKNLTARARPLRPRFFEPVRRCALPLSALIYLLILGGCVQVVQPIPLSDTRLPAEAKQRIADAEDALVIASGRLEDAQAKLEEARMKQSRFNLKPPPLGSAQGAAQSVVDQRVLLSTTLRDYARSEFVLSQERLTLIYAQTAMRYDLKVYRLKSITDRVERQQKKMLQLRTQIKGARRSWEESLSAWWDAYKQLAQAKNTHPFWIYEFSR